MLYSKLWGTKLSVCADCLAVLQKMNLRVEFHPEGEESTATASSAAVGLAEATIGKPLPPGAVAPIVTVELHQSASGPTEHTRPKALALDKVRVQSGRDHQKLSRRVGGGGCV